MLKLLLTMINKYCRCPTLSCSFVLILSKVVVNICKLIIII